MKVWGKLLVLLIGAGLQEAACTTHAVAALRDYDDYQHEAVDASWDRLHNDDPNDEEVESDLSPDVKHGHLDFSKTICRIFSDHELEDIAQSGQNEIIWERPDADHEFNELIISWNAFRPVKGSITIWVGVKYNGKWAPWHRLATWSAKHQQTFLNKLHPHVHTKHCRVEMQRNHLAQGFRAKVVFNNGADPRDFKAFFGCVSQVKNMKVIPVGSDLETVFIDNIRRQSQMVLDHERFKDLCSPVSTSMMIAYFYELMSGRKFNKRMSSFACDFANKIHDMGKLDVFGNWILNMVQAFHESDGKVYFSVQRLNSFYQLYHYLKQKIPVAVSVRRLRGGATPYANGHLMLVVGWNKKRRRVICVDPAFGSNHTTLKSYPITSFLQAWGRSNNLSYVPLLKDMIN
jgi:hypothetical protein